MWEARPSVQPEAPEREAPAPEPVAPPEPTVVELVVPADAVMGLQLETTVSSDRAKVEDAVEARVTRDVRVGGRVAITAGSLVQGTVTEVVRGGKGTLAGQLSWLGSPLALDYPSLAGEVAMAVDAGQFLKVDPGAARLLGVLNLQALPRRLALDFRDVFQEGFAFDNVSGDVTVTISGAQRPAGWSTPIATVSVPVTVSTPGPAAPVLSCGPRSGNTISFTWTSVSGETYTLFMATSNEEAGYAPVGTVAPPHVVSPGQNTEVFYRVKAANSQSGVSEFSNTIRVARDNGASTITCQEVTP